MTSVMPTGDKQTKAATPAQIKAAEKRLTKARSVLAMDPQWSLFSALIFGMECKVSEMVPTAGTNGKTVWYNPLFIESLTDSQVRFLVLHETLHPALDHTLPSRFKDKDLAIWNAAADYVINYAACENGSEFTPKTIEAMDGLFDANLYRDNDGNADKIYKVLAEEQAKEPQEPDGPGRQGGDGPVGPGGEPSNSQDGDPRSGSNNGPNRGQRKGKPIDDITVDPISEDEEYEQKILVREALMRVRKSEHFGKLGGAMQRLIESLDIDKPRWTEVLDNFLARDTSDRSWARPNNRFASQGIYLPSDDGESVGCIVVSLDVSGSIGPDELNLRAAEILSIVENYNPQRLVVLSHDVDAYLVDECEQGEVPNLKNIEGGGGTAFVKVIEKAAEYEPDVFVGLTDLYGRFPDAPEFPCVWASTGKDTAPFGDVVMIDG